MGACAHVLVFYISLLGEWKKKTEENKSTEDARAGVRVCVFVFS